MEQAQARATHAEAAVGVDAGAARRELRTSLLARQESLRALGQAQEGATAAPTAEQEALAEAEAVRRQGETGFGFGDTSEFDPFLLFDDFRGDHPRDYSAGFPWHPHRGIETITYVLAGTVEHGDSLGNKGTLGPGSLQLMTAGRGISHSEVSTAGTSVLHRNVGAAPATPGIIVSVQPLPVSTRPDTSTVAPDGRLSAGGDALVIWVNVAGSPPVLPNNVVAPAPDASFSPPARHDGDVAWLIGTSGTTGVPKLAMLTDASLLAAVESTLPARPVGPTDVLLTPFPLCHVAGYNVFVLHRRAHHHGSGEAQRA